MCQKCEFDMRMNQYDSGISTARILVRRLDKISKITAITGLTLFGLVSVNYVISIFNSNTFPIHYFWYALGLCFILWFATRKGGCERCNQRGFNT
jgi:hypothetical protein